MNMDNNVSVEKKSKSIQNGIIYALAAAIVFMSIGFAAYTTTLRIGGNTGNGAKVTVKPATWSVHWQHNGSSSDFVASTGSQPFTETSVTDTDVAFNTTLNAPGEFCEFTVKVINDGTLDADLKTVTLTINNGDPALIPYVSYSLKYNNGTPYTANVNNVSNVTLPATTGNIHDVVVRVEYIYPEHDTDLPTSQVTLNLQASLDFAHDTD